MRPVVTAVLPSVTALGEREGPASSPVTAAGVSAQLVPAGSSAPSVPLVPGSQTDISPSRVEISHIQFYLGKTFGLAVCQPPATAMPAAKGTRDPVVQDWLGTASLALWTPRHWPGCKDLTLFICIPSAQDSV